MSCAPQLLNIKNRRTKSRIIVFAFLICFIIASPLSEAYILSQANQEHEHNDIDGRCATCVHIQNTVNMLKQLAIYPGGTLSAFIDSTAAIMFIYSVLSLIAFCTLINLKVRLNN